MKIQKGSVVKADAGRDCGGYFAVVEMQDGYCFIADGKSRKLLFPKRKKIKHLSFTKSVIPLNDIPDKTLRTLLREFSQADE